MLTHLLTCDVYGHKLLWFWLESKRLALDKTTCMAPQQLAHQETGIQPFHVQWLNSWGVLLESDLEVYAEWLCLRLMHVATWASVSWWTQCEVWRDKETLHFYCSAEWTATQWDQEWVDTIHCTQITPAGRVGWLHPKSMGYSSW